MQPCVDVAASDKSGNADSHSVLDNNFGASSAFCSSARGDNKLHFAVDGGARGPRSRQARRDILFSTTAQYSDKNASFFRIRPARSGLP